jgi:PAS domain S-box-containing protein
MLSAVLPAFLVVTGVAAQEEITREYTAEQPLVYEDVWDLYPYSFLNENGEPDGFNIDLMHMVLDKLGIPYRIELKPMQDAYEDLRDHKSDLMMGLSAGFHDDYGFYGRNSVTLFTQSALSPKSKPVEITRFRDLRDHDVIVLRGSLTHHLLMDYGYLSHATIIDDMKEAVLKMSVDEEGTVVWNSTSLKWLLHRYHIDNLELIPVDMPHGEYRFMSCDKKLLAKLDSVYAELNSQDKIVPLHNKWYYPEKTKAKVPTTIYTLGGIAGLLALLFTVYYAVYNIHSRRITRQTDTRNKRLSLILETSRVRLWTYDVATAIFTRLSEKGQEAYTYTVDDFSNQYHHGDFELLMKALHQLIDDDSPIPGKDDEKEISIVVRAQDTEEGDTEEHYFTIVLSVLNRDANGKALTILGTKRDISSEWLQQRQQKERELSYWAIFETSMVGVIYFGRDGIMTHINKKGCEILDCDERELIDTHVDFHDLLALDRDITMADLDGLHVTHLDNIDAIPPDQRKFNAIKRTGRLYEEVRLSTVFGNKNEVIGMFALFRDMTERIKIAKQQMEAMERVRQANSELTEYVQNINYVLKTGGMRLANYSPSSHMLTVFSGINEIQHALTQTRCMTLVDERWQKKAMRMLNNMDYRTTADINTDIRTTIRGHNRQILHLAFHFFPVTDQEGNVTDYFGLCRDITEQKATEQQLEQETARAQEVEQAKYSFLHNMSHEIRTPLNAVVGFAELFELEHATEDEEVFVKEILSNSDHLLHLINSILFLSRLEAHMIEINKQPYDFALMFESSCEDGWGKYKQPDVKYVVENPYESLIVDIDAANLSRVIQQVAANAAQYTHSGSVRARYDYVGRKLRIYIEDTGDGISADDLNRIYDRFMSRRQNGSGLGLPISKELIEQMGGTLEINSDAGLGTTVWITIPCQATEVRRKKIL